MRLYVNLLLLTIVGIIQAGAQENNLNVEEVLVMFRHGERTRKSYECYPTDDKFNDRLSRDYKLVEKGKSHMAALGKLLRLTYGNIFKDYCTDCVGAGTLAYSPANESLHLVLKSIYPDLTIPIMKTELTDFLLSRRCPKFNTLLRDTYLSPDVKEQLDQLSEFFLNISNYSGIPGVDLKKALLLANTLEVEESTNVVIPYWYTPDIKGKLKAVVKFFYKIYTYQPEMKQIAAGPILGHLLKEIKTTATVQKRLFLYSVNQEQMESFLQGLDLGADKETSFGSAIILEKLRVADKIQIRFKYYKGNGYDFETLTLNGCTAECPLDTLSNIVKPIIEVPEIKENEPSNDVLKPIYDLCTASNDEFPENDLNAIEQNVCDEILALP